MSDETTDDGVRPRGILSPADRRFLRGETEYAHAPTATERRNTITERVENALIDFELLFDELPPHLRRDVFRGEGHHAEPDVFSGRIYALAFLYLGVVDNHGPRGDSFFGDYIEDGIRLALAKEGVGVSDMSVEIEVWRETLLDAAEDAALEELPPMVLVRLHGDGRLTDDEFAEAVKAGD